MVYLRVPAMEKQSGSLLQFIDQKITTDSNEDFKNKTKTQMLKEYEQKMGKPGSKRPLSRIPLWYFLHEILEVEKCRDLIKWEDEKNLVFTIKKPKELAILWGKIKNKETMTYPKLARGIRYYYGKGVIEKFNGKRFSYKFIVSRKTKAVLSKRKNLPEEVSIVQKKYTSRKRKRSSELSDACNVELKRSRDEDVEDDVLNSNVSEWGSDEDDSLSESELKNLDQCLSEIFEDPKFGFLFPESRLFQNEREDSDMFIMKKEPSGLSNIQLLNEFANSSTPFSLDDCNSNSRQQSIQSPKQSENTDIFDIYKQLTEETDTLISNTSWHKNSDYQNAFVGCKQTLASNFINSSGGFRKKSKSESDFHYAMFGESSFASAPLTNLYRSANHVGSLPDFSTINNCKNDRNKGYYTNLLLNGGSNDTSIDQDIALDAVVLDDNIFNL